MEENKFLFSIIIPVYNTEKYIKKCLDSVKKAMDKDCEVIIVNDGATDNSEKEIFKFLERIPKEYKNNFKYIKKKNKGLADTKNVGIEAARGQYISFVDSDDYISEDFYKIARNYTNNFDIIIYDIYVIFEKDKNCNYVSRAKVDWKENEKVAIIGGAISGSSCNKIIKKQLYNMHKFPVGKQYEDTAVTPFILSEAKNIKYLPYAMYYYTQREKSIVSTNTIVSAFYKICSNISDVIEEKGNMEQYKYAINEFFTDRIYDMFVENLKENRKEFLKDIEKFAEKNKEIIKYILSSDMLNKIENHYSDRQKKITQEFLKSLIDGNYKRIKTILTIRKIINTIRLRK